MNVTPPRRPPPFLAQLKQKPGKKVNPLNAMLLKKKQNRLQPEKRSPVKVKKSETKSISKILIQALCNTDTLPELLHDTIAHPNGNLVQFLNENKMDLIRAFKSIEDIDMLLIEIFLNGTLSEIDEQVTLFANFIKTNNPEAPEKMEVVITALKNARNQNFTTLLELLNGSNSPLDKIIPRLFRAYPELNPSEYGLKIEIKELINNDLIEQFKIDIENRTLLGNKNKENRLQWKKTLHFFNVYFNKGPRKYNQKDIRIDELKTKMKTLGWTEESITKKQTAQQTGSTPTIEKWYAAQIKEYKGDIQDFDDTNLLEDITIKRLKKIPDNEEKRTTKDREIIYLAYIQNEINTIKEKVKTAALGTINESLKTLEEDLNEKLKDKDSEIAKLMDKEVHY